LRLPTYKHENFIKTVLYLNLDLKSLVGPTPLSFTCRDLIATSLALNQFPLMFIRSQDNVLNYAPDKTQNLLF